METDREEGEQIYLNRPSCKGRGCPHSFNSYAAPIDRHLPLPLSKLATVSFRLDFREETVK